MNKVFKSWGFFFKLLITHPGIVLPFLLTALFNSIALCLVYLAPQRPVSLVLGPPVIRFFGERFLHYPLNLVLLPKLFYYAQVAVSATLGLIFSAAAVKMIADFLNQGRSSFISGLMHACKRYFALFFVWLIPFALATYSFKFLVRFLPQGPGQYNDPAMYAIFIAAVLIQMLFIFAVPCLMIGNKSWFSALIVNFKFLAGSFLPALSLVLVPSLFYLPLLSLKLRGVMLMTRFFPEIVLLTLIAGIIMMFFIDIAVISATTILFVNEKKEL